MACRIGGIMKLNISLFIFMLMALGSQAQNFGNSKIVVQGRVTQLLPIDSLERPLDKVTIQIWRGDQLVKECKSAHRGRYRVDVPYASNYQVKYVLDGYVSKLVEFDAENLKKEEGAFQMFLVVDIALFKNDENFDFTFLESTPVAKAEVTRRGHNIVWDTDYSNDIKLLIENEVKRGRKQIASLK